MENWVPLSRLPSTVGKYLQRGGEVRMGSCGLSLPTLNWLQSPLKATNCPHG